MIKLAWTCVAVVLAGAWPAVTSGQTTQPSTGHASGASTARSTAPSAEQVMNQLLSPVQTPPARQLPVATAGPMTDATSGKATVAPGAATLNVMREGTFIINRVGRLTRSADGQQAEFAFDADGKAMRDPPVVILPNLKLMQMENAAAGSSRDLRFRVSGMVTEYKGRNYALLDKVVVVPEVDQQF